MEISNPQLENHHGVFINISGHGVLIIGDAGIGKSSLALELIAQGHSLIADDIIEFSTMNELTIGHCPLLLKGLLHTRELGLISIPIIYGENAYQYSHPLHSVIELTHQLDNDVSLSIPTKSYSVLGKSFPLVSFSTANPATLHTRLSCWLSMQSEQHQPEHTFSKHHQSIMKIV